MLPTGRSPPARRFKLGTLTVIALVFVPIALIPPVALKWSYEKLLRDLEDKFGIAQEALLECQDSFAGLEKDLRKEQMARTLSEGQLAGAKQSVEDQGDEREQLLAAIRDVKAKGEADLSKAMARVVKLEEQLEQQRQSAALEVEEQKKQVSKLNQSLKAKKEELEGYHKLIVKQKEELERKTQTINTFLNDRQVLLKNHGADAPLPPHQPAPAPTVSNSSSITKVPALPAAARDKASQGL